MERNQVVELNNPDFCHGYLAADPFISILQRCGRSGVGLIENQTLEFTADEGRKIADLAQTNKDRIPVKGHWVDRLIGVFERGPVTATLSTLGGPLLDDEQIDKIMQSDPLVWK